MQSVKSYFNLTLYRKNLARFWPLWGLYALVWMFALPLNILMQSADYYGRNPHSAAGLLVEFSGPWGVSLAAIFAILCVMAVFSYLYNPKSVSMLHSLPIRREGLFLTNYLSGLSFLVLPQVLIFLLTLGAAAVQGVSVLPQLLLWLLLQVLYSILFYSFAVFCAMFTGNLLALPVFYGILNFLVLGVSYVLNQLMRYFIYGFSGWDWMSEAAMWLTPAAKLCDEIHSVWTEGTELSMITGVPYAFLYAGVGLIFAGLALFAYRRRKLETAGDLISIRWVRPVFKYGVALTAAVVIGSWLYDIFRRSLPRTAWVILAFLLFTGILGYFGAEMLLKKSFRVFRTGWKGCLAVCLLLIAATCAMEFDLIGFNRAPAAESVQSVELRGISSRPDDGGGYSNLTFTEPEDLEKIAALHHQITTHKTQLLRSVDTMETRYGTNDYQTATTAWVELVYSLKNGNTVRRSYDLPIYQADLADPTSIPALLTALINTPESIHAAYRNNIPKDAKLVAVERSTYEDGGHSIDDSDDQTALLAAVQSDLAAGRIGRRYLFSDQERMENCYYSDLEFTFYRPADKIAPGERYGRENWSLCITIQTTSTDTIQALRDMGDLTEKAPLQTLSGEKLAK